MAERRGMEKRRFIIVTILTGLIVFSLGAMFGWSIKPESQSSEIIVDEYDLLLEETGVQITSTTFDENRTAYEQLWYNISIAGFNISPPPDIIEDRCYVNLIHINAQRPRYDIHANLTLTITALYPANDSRIDKIAVLQRDYFNGTIQYYCVNHFNPTYTFTHYSIDSFTVAVFGHKSEHLPYDYTTLGIVMKINASELWHDPYATSPMYWEGDIP